MEEIMSISETFRFPNTGMRGILLDGLSAQDNGDWLDVEGYGKKTIEVIISNSAAVQVYVSNAPTKPLNTEDHIKVGADVSASALIELTSPVRWLKAKVSAWTSGTVSAYVNGIPV
jgi:hypothetical protein